MIEEGMSFPSFSLPNQNGDIVTNKQLQGQSVIFYFYPKDDTPGCTKEGQDFSDYLDDFHNKGVRVFGVSKCSIKAHNSFCNKYEFRHDLLSDADGTLCENVGVWKEKRMYGRSYMGIERTTVLVDANGIVTKIWTPVKGTAPVDTVLTFIA